MCPSEKCSSGKFGMQIFNKNGWIFHSHSRSQSPFLLRMTDGFLSKKRRLLGRDYFIPYRTTLNIAWIIKFVSAIYLYFFAIDIFVFVVLKNMSLTLVLWVKFHYSFWRSSLCSFTISHSNCSRLK